MPMFLEPMQYFLPHMRLHPHPHCQYDIPETLTMVLQRGESSRLFTHAILHAHTIHLATNMGELVADGAPVEAKYGGPSFALLIAELWITSSLLYCGYHQFMGHGVGSGVYVKPFVGFAGTLSAMTYMQLLRAICLTFACC